MRWSCLFVSYRRQPVCGVALKANGVVCPPFIRLPQPRDRTAAGEHWLAQRLRQRKFATIGWMAELFAKAACATRSDYFAGAECDSPLCGRSGVGPTPRGSSLVVFGMF